MPASFFDKTADLSFGIDVFLSNRQPYNVDDIATDIAVEDVTVFRGEDEFQIDPANVDVSQNPTDPVGRYNVLLTNDTILDSAGVAFVLEDGDDVRFRVRVTTTPAEGDIVVVRDFDIQDTTVPRGYFELPQNIQFQPSIDGGVENEDGFVFSLFDPDGQALVGATIDVSAILHSRGATDTSADSINSYSVTELAGGRYKINAIALSAGLDPIELQAGDEVHFTLTATVDDNLVTGTTTVQVEAQGTGGGRIDVSESIFAIPSADGTFQDFEVFVFDSAGQLDPNAVVTIDRAMLFSTVNGASSVTNSAFVVTTANPGVHLIQPDAGADAPVRHGDYLQYLLKTEIEGKTAYRLVEIVFRATETPRLLIQDGLKFVPSSGGTNIKASVQVVTGTLDPAGDAESSVGAIQAVRLQKQDGTVIDGVPANFSYLHVDGSRWQLEHAVGFESAPGVPEPLEAGDAVHFEISHEYETFPTLTGTITASITAAGRPFAI